VSTLRKVALFGQYGGLAWMMAALPLANWLMSVGVITFGCAWLLHIIADRSEGKPAAARWFGFRHNPAALRFALLYCVFFVSILWTENLAYGLKDLKTKLPILLLPLFVSGMDPVSALSVRRIWNVFLAALVFAVTVCLTVYFGWYNDWAVPLGFRAREVKNFRDISIFISHIRFSLLLLTGIVVLATREGGSARSRAGRVLTAAYFAGFLWIMESVTALAISGVLLAVWLIYRIRKGRGRTVARAGLAALAVLLVAGIWLVVKEYRTQFTASSVTFGELDTHTPYGEPYEHHPGFRQVENGHFTMLYIARGELSSEWEQRSRIPFDSLDKTGFPVSATLIRYLTSRGLRKDRDGMRMLSDEEIGRIERGVASVRLAEHRGIRRRLDRILFEYHIYAIGGDPSGHSVFQRLEFWKAGWGIIRQHPLLGVGVGDTKRAFSVQYESMDSRLDETHRLRAHNQWMTVWITSGIIGLLLFTAWWFAPLRRTVRAHSPLFIGFFIIATMSMFTEDTLESQAGVSFVAFLTAFMLFLPKAPADP
jgi:putative effector of murein hydrolase LrgA (UPF0299 family)